MTRRMVMPLLVAVAAVVLGGCASPASTGAAPAPASSPAVAAPTPASSSAGGSGSPSASAPVGPTTAVEPTSVEPAAAAVPEQLQFTATTLDGEPFNGANLAGKPAVFWFWAPWCPNCRAEAPQVAAAAAANPDVTFIGVAAQDELPAMQAFVTDYGVGGFQHLADLDAGIWQRFGVTLQPAYAFVDADGSIEVVKNRVSADELASRLAQLTG